MLSDMIASKFQDYVTETEYDVVNSEAARSEPDEFYNVKN